MTTWYRTGTVAVTNGDDDVVGTDTLWASQASAGDVFVGPDGALYEITAVTDNTHIKIKKLNGTAAYNGSTASAQTYAIIRNFTSTLPAELAAKLADLIDDYHVTLDDLVNWLTGTGTVTVHDALGVGHSLKTPDALEAGINGMLTKSVAGSSNVALTSTEAANNVIKLTGTLTGNIEVTVPASSPHVYTVLDATSGAYTVTFKPVGGSGVVLLKGTYQSVAVDGTNALPAHSALYAGSVKIVEASPLGASVTGTLNVSGVTVLLGGSSLGLTVRSNGVTTEEYDGTDSITVNYRGYQNGTTRFRNFNVYDGKEGLIASFSNGLLELSGSHRPGIDNTYNLGSASLGWKEIFCDNGTINTSDARKKTTVRALEDAELAASTEMAREIGAFQFLAAVAEKGEAARLHIGMTVQRAIAIMSAHGLDAMRYSFICHDAWDDEYVDHPAIEAADAVAACPAEYRTETYDETVLVDGEPVTLQRTRLVEVSPAVAARPAVAAQDAWREKVRDAGDKYSFRAHELLLFLARGFEARLTALEA